MRVLFVHQNFPAQFRHLAPALARRGDEVRALANTPRAELEGVTLQKYEVPRGSTKGIHPYAVDFETKSIYAEACAKAMVELRSTGFAPDIVIGHPGWGETWLVKEVWKDTKVLAFQEFYYGADVAYDPEFCVDAEASRWRARVKNFGILAGLETMDYGLSPTEWQKAQFPAHFRKRIGVVFDGIDTDLIAPNPDSYITLQKAGLVLRAGDEVVTFVNRNLEPYRGYHSFMRALPRLFELRPNARVVIVGGSDGGYGSRPQEGTWRERFLNEVRDRVDRSRIHFVGRVSHATLADIYRVSACHVYLTYPFVLSWSMLECMSAGGLVIGSRTPPVEEIIQHGHNGLLVDFFDPAGIANTVAATLAEPSRYTPLREAARRTIVERYDLNRVCLPQQLQLVDKVASGAVP